MAYEDVIKKLRHYALCCPWCGRKCATKQSLRCHEVACPGKNEFIIFAGDFYDVLHPLLKFEKHYISAATFGLIENFIIKAGKLTGRL